MPIRFGLVRRRRRREREVVVARLPLHRLRCVVSFILFYPQLPPLPFYSLNNQAFACDENGKGFTSLCVFIPRRREYKTKEEKKKRLFSFFFLYKRGLNETASKVTNGLWVGLVGRIEMQILSYCK